MNAGKWGVDNIPVRGLRSWVLSNGPDVITAEANDHGVTQEIERCGRKACAAW